MTGIRLCGLLAMVLLLSAGAHAEEYKFGKISDEHWAMQPPADYPETNAMKIFDNAQLEVMIDGIKLHRHVRIKVFNQAGGEEVGDIDIRLYEEDKLKNLKAHTVTPGGKKYEVKDVFTKTVGSRKIKTFSFPNIEDGAILEFQYDLFHERFAHLDPWYFQSDLYTKESQFNLILGAGFAYTTAFCNVSRSNQDARVEQHRVTNNRQFTWELTDLPAITYEPYMSCYTDYVSSMHCQLVSWENQYNKVTYIRNWQELGKETSEWVDEYARKKGDLKDLVATLGVDATDPLGRAKAIYSFVCCQIKTQNDPNGYYLSHDHLDKLLEDRFGTEDEKNILLVEMMRAAGFEAWPVYISTREHGAFKPNVYQTRQFNHFIAYAVVDSVGYFLDATTKYCPFGVLPPSSLAEGGFLIDGENSELIRLFSTVPENYRQDITDVVINADGEVSCSTTVKLGGYLAAEYGEYYEQEQSRDFAIDHFLDNLDLEYELQSVDFHQDSVSNECEVTLRFTIDGLASQLDDNLVLDPVHFRFGKNPLVKEKRAFPVDFAYPFSHHNIVRFRSESGNLVAGEQVDPVVFNIPGAAYAKVVSVADGLVVAEYKLQLLNSSFGPSQYRELRDFFVQVGETAQEPLVVTTQ